MYQVLRTLKYLPTLLSYRRSKIEEVRPARVGANACKILKSMMNIMGRLLDYLLDYLIYLSGKDDLLYTKTTYYI